MPGTVTRVCRTATFAAGSTGRMEIVRGAMAGRRGSGAAAGMEVSRRRIHIGPQRRQRFRRRRPWRCHGGRAVAQPPRARRPCFCVDLQAFPRSVPGGNERFVERGSPRAPRPPSRRRRNRAQHPRRRLRRPQIRGEATQSPNFARLFERQCAQGMRERVGKEARLRFRGVPALRPAGGNVDGRLGAQAPRQRGALGFEPPGEGAVFRTGAESHRPPAYGAGGPCVPRRNGNDAGAESSAQGRLNRERRRPGAGQRISPRDLFGEDERRRRFPVRGR